MYETFLHFLLETGMAIQTQFTVSTRLQLVFCGIILRMASGRGKNVNHSAKQYYNSVIISHSIAPHMAIVLYDSHRMFFPQKEDALHP
jgi:hypothetical protein